MSVWPVWAQEVHPVVEVSDPVIPFVIDVDLRDLPAPPTWKPGDPIKEVPKIRERKVPFYQEPTNQIDPLLAQQASVAAGNDRDFDTTIRNFNGQGFTGVNPPDTVGDVGINYYIQAINDSGGTLYVVYNKSDGSVAAGPFSLEDLATNAPCTSGFGDPVVLFDRLANRWLLTEFPPSGNSDLCVYISQTSDPISGGWFAYTFNTINFPDYPKYGVWPDAYYVTTNEATSRIWTLDRQQMLIGAAATSQVFNLVDLTGFGFQTATPASVTGLIAPPPGSPGIIMRHRDDEVHNAGSNDPSQDFLELYEVTVDFDTPANSMLVGPFNIPVAEFDSSLCGLTSFNCFPQPGSGTTLDPLREVVMFPLQYRNFEDHETLVGNFVTDVNGSNLGGIRWFELRKTGRGSGWSVFQEGTYSPDSVNRWMGGISIDVSGNIALGYNVSDSTSVFPGLRYAGRLVDDPVGTLPQGEHVIVNGSAANGSNRYGDYSAMGVDPVDDCTFWFTGEYNAASSWSTRIASFRFDACGCEPPDSPAGLTATPNGDNQVDLSWSAVAGAESYNVYRTVGSCPQVGFQLLATGVVGTTYSDTTVSGGTTYAYSVRAFDQQEDCLSSFGNCDDALATGECLIPPDFDGIAAVTNAQLESCSLDITWAAGSTTCGGSLVYNIYRSQTPGFMPAPGNLIASCVTGTTYTDSNVESGVTYYYIVRSEDMTGLGTGPCANGLQDTNTVELSGAATGPDEVFFEDDIESGPGNWTTETLPADTGTSPWAIVKGDTNNWFCSDEAVVKDQVTRLTNPVAVGAATRLLFRHQVNTENNWDGGVLEYSTDGGSTWFDILAGNGGSIPANAGRFLANGYNGTLNTSANPLGGRPAWFGNSNGYKEVEVDLADFNGANVDFRWRLGCDASQSRPGWWVDDVRIIAGSECGGCTLLGLVPFWPDVNILEMLACPLIGNEE